MCLLCKVRHSYLPGIKPYNYSSHKKICELDVQHYIIGHIDHIACSVIFTDKK